MKILSLALISLVLSISLAGQAAALQNTLPVNNINKLLQMKIDQGVLNSFGGDAYLPRQHDISAPVKEKQHINQPVDTFSVPDCLCLLFTRVL